VAVVSDLLCDFEPVLAFEYFHKFPGVATVSAVGHALSVWLIVEVALGANGRSENADGTEFHQLPYEPFGRVALKQYGLVVGNVSAIVAIDS
jgi:hypothetical protein